MPSSSKRRRTIARRAPRSREAGGMNLKLGIFTFPDATDPEGTLA
jgi:hypothetical protein